MNRSMFSLTSLLPPLDADGGGAGGDAGTSASGDAAAATTAPTQDSGQAGQPPQPFAIFPDEKSFTARLRREAKSQLESRAKELGFESVDAMEAVLKAARERADADKSELERAQEAAARAQEAVSKAESDRQTALAQANERAIRAEAKLQAAALGIKPERVAHALRLADLSPVAIGDDGEPDSKAIVTALEAVLAELPELKGAAQTVGGGSNPPGGDNTGKIDVSKLSREEFAALERRIRNGERIQL